jgi:hypothetical protein
LNFGISGFGVGPHVLVEAIFDIVDLQPPNYVTAGSCRNAAVALIAGEVDMAMCTFSAAVDFVKAGQLRALTVTTAEDYKVDDITIPASLEFLQGATIFPYSQKHGRFLSEEIRLRILLINSTKRSYGPSNSPKSRNSLIVRHLTSPASMARPRTAFFLSQKQDIPGPCITLVWLKNRRRT